MNNVVKIYSDYFDSYEETYDEEGSNEKEGLEPKQFKITGIEDNKLPKWLEWRNDFNKANKLINDIRFDTNNVEVSYKDEEVFDGLNRLITEISNNKVKKEDANKKLKEVYLT